jgi:hypothetical protein
MLMSAIEEMDATGNSQQSNSEILIDKGQSP